VKGGKQRHTLGSILTTASKGSRAENGVKVVKV
jgi:hypothetical protein